MSRDRSMPEMRRLPPVRLRPRACDGEAGTVTLKICHRNVEQLPAQPVPQKPREAHRPGACLPAQEDSRVSTLADALCRNCTAQAGRSRSFPSAKPHGRNPMKLLGERDLNAKAWLFTGDAGQRRIRLRLGPFNFLLAVSEAVDLATQLADAVAASRATPVTDREQE